MPFNLRLPNITGTTDRERMAQMQNYMYQIVEQLNWALNTIETSGGSVSSSIVYTSKNSLLKENEKLVVDEQATFNAIKGLIIKSADIVSAYYEEMVRTFNSEYFAESDFGTYKQNVEQRITANADSITQAFTNIQIVRDDVAEVNAYIKLGMLYEEDGIPVHGLEIGQRNERNGDITHNMFARFISDRLSFYDEYGIEVAYISKDKLYITNAEIKGILTLGAFQIDTSKGFRLKWVGRG